MELRARATRGLLRRIAPGPRHVPRISRPLSDTPVYGRGRLHGPVGSPSSQDGAEVGGVLCWNLVLVFICVLPLAYVDVSKRRQPTFNRSIRLFSRVTIADKLTSLHRPPRCTFSTCTGFERHLGCGCISSAKCISISFRQRDAEKYPSVLVASGILPTVQPRRYDCESTCNGATNDCTCVVE